MSDWTGPTCLMCDGTGEDFTYSGNPMEVARRDVPTGSPCRACNGHGREAETTLHDGECRRCGAVEVALVNGISGWQDLSHIGEGYRYPYGYGCEVCG